MVYLEDFRLPCEEYEDWYFSPPSEDCEKTEKLQRMKKLLENRFPVGDEYPYGILQASKMTGFTSWYPWKIFYQRGLLDYSFEDITIFYGGNGSGKTTMLNVIAQKLQLQRTTLYNRSSFFDDYLEFCDYYLTTDRNSLSAIQRGCIITSDDVFDNMLKIRDANQNIDFNRDRLMDEYSELPPKKNMPSCSKFVRSRLSSNQQEQSNGETGFQYFVNAIQNNSLVLLDEPENSLSAQWQMELAQFLQGAIRAFNCQLIIATHSPFVLSIPGAKIYNLDAAPIQTSKWQDLENIRCYYDLFKRYENRFIE